MADNKKAERHASPDELLSKQAEKDRLAVLEEEDPAIAIHKAAESSNLEFQAADHFVNSEKTLPAERMRRGRRILVTNHTPAGLPSDVHQALVASSQLRRNEAMAYRDIEALIAKYGGSEDPQGDAIPKDVRAHLEEELSELKLAAKFDDNARTLLEKYT